jgi:D-beta-D-heptose 7-phosphate kinase/D-beta-D-heptose 1-phosphate adenosyltransferase
MSKLSRSLSAKLRTPEELQELIGTQAPRASQVVFTNGCFDILHAGHARYLEQARNLGDVLVVALNSDESVKRLKGSERPLNSLQDRLEVMASLEAVDWVTWFEDDTPLNLIRKIRPDFLAKGGDWQVDQIVGGADVLSWGGEVRSIPFVEGRSTTRLIEKARAAPIKS